MAVVPIGWIEGYRVLPGFYQDFGPKVTTGLPSAADRIPRGRKTNYRVLLGFFPSVTRATLFLTRVFIRALIPTDMASCSWSQVGVEDFFFFLFVAVDSASLTFAVAESYRVLPSFFFAVFFVFPAATSGGSPSKTPTRDR